MGVEQTKSLLKTFYSTPLVSGDNYLKMAFTTECLQLDDFINYYWKEKASEHLGSTNIPTKTPVNERDKEKFLLKEELLLNEIPLSKQNPSKAFNIECLAEYRNPFIPENTNKFSQMQMKRMNVLLFVYVRKILEDFNENSTIECISKYFDSLIKNKDKVDVNSLGINLFIKLVSDISKGNVQIKEKNLDFMLENNKFIRPLSFYGETKEHFILDKALDKIIEYLKELITDKNEKDINKIKALKIIFNLALAKGSIKNLLDVIVYLDKLPQKNIDFNYELNLFKNEFRKFGLGTPNSNNKRLDSVIWNYTIKKEDDKEKNKSKKDFFSTTTDGSYLYYFCSKGILLKIGTGFNNTMLGKIYNKKENYRYGEKATITYVEGILYYRSNNLDPYPIISLDPETLEEIPNKFNVDYSEINHIFMEEKRSEFEFPHSSYEDMMELIERKRTLGLEDKSNIRPGDASPMLSDGRFIYIVSKWYDQEDEGDKKDEEDDGDINPNAKSKKSYAIFGVNVYDPLNNMCHVRSLQLIPVLTEKQEKTDSEKQNKNNNTSLFNDINPRNNRNTMYDRNNPNNNRNIHMENMVRWDDILNGNRDNNKEENQERIIMERDFLQGQNHLYTNGAILYINQYKFSLVTGHLLGYCSLNSNATNSYCYDFKNNLIWCIDQENVANKVKITSYFNESAKLIFDYPKGHPKYSPCNIEKIIEQCEKNINLSNLKEEVTNNKFKHQETLDLLGLEDEQSKNYKETKIINDKITKEQNYEQYILNLQCFILNTIAKVSEFYGQVPDLKIASNDIERGKILSQAMRRPFCVKLEPITFKELIKLLMQFSKNFIKGNYTDIEAFSLLAIVKIIRTNLKCLSISNLGIDYLLKKNGEENINPFFQMKEFIFNIIKIYHDDKIEKNDLFKAVYEECKIILKVSVNTLYQKNSEIVQILCDNLDNNFKKNNYSKDVASCILYWISDQDNIHKILKNADEKTINKIFDIFKKISSLEISSLEQFLFENKNNLDVSELKSFKNNDFERVSFEFISSFQLELIKFLSKKLINDQYEDSYYEKLIHLFTKILFNNLTKIFSSLNNYIEKIIKKIEENYNEKYCSNTISTINDEEEEDMICTSTKKEEEEESIITTNKIEEKNKENKNTPTLEDYKKEIMNNIYKNFILKKIINNLLHIKILIFHINSLSILSSDYILSAYLLQDFIPLIKEMNEIYSKITSNCSIKTEEIFVKNEEYKEVIFETDHPYTTGTPKEFNLEIPGQKGPLYIEFDEKSQICTPEEVSCPNAIYFYRDKRIRSENYFPEFPKITTTFPKKPLEVKTFPCYLIFNAFMKNTNNCYGFKLKLHNGKDVNIKKEISDDLFNLTRLVNWVGCKCTAVIIKGIFIKPQGNEGNEKYQELLKDDLFKEGLNLNELFNDNEKIIHNLVEIFNLYKKDFNFESLDNKQKEEKNKFIEEELKLFKDEKCISTLKIFQKKLASKNIAHNVGGEDGFKLVMVCFLAMIHHSGEMKYFIENIIGKGENEIISSPKFESLYKKYVLASQMRSWLVEKKKNIAESIEKNNKDNEVENDKLDNGELKVENYVKKIINQATNKSKFLIKINQNKNFTEEKDLNNLCSSIISYLKENLSNKKLQRNIKIYTLRAIGRQIGLETINEIFTSISNGVLLQDLLSWFNASLKYNNNSENNNSNDFNSYLDNISGCGETLKNNIKNSFQNFLSLLITKYLQNSDEKELESFFDTLIWKYNLEDHQFLLEKSMFNIIWGLENQTIKNAWGKSFISPVQLDLKKTKSNSEIAAINNNLNSMYETYYRTESLFGNMPSLYMDHMKESFKSTTAPISQSSRNLTNEVLEVFEILSSICINSVIVNKNEVYNLNYTSALVQNIINIVFGEIEKATSNYLDHRGISKRLVRQYQSFIEDGNNKEILKKKEKDKKVNEMIELIRQERIEELNRGELDYEQDEDDYCGSLDTEEREREFIERGIDRVAIERQVSDLERKNNEKEPKNKNSERTFFFTQSDIENLYDNVVKIPHSKKEKKIYITSDELFNIISSQWSVIYNPKFLNRLLQILYKVSIQNNKVILDCINSSDYIYSLIKLIKYCSTPEKLLSAKILGNLCIKSSEENLNEAIELYYDDYGKKYNNFIDLLIDNTLSVRKASWNNGSFNSTGNYIISNYLINIIRELVYNSKFTKEVNELINTLNLNECKTKEDYLKKEIILGIIGADFFGQADGARVQVPNPLFSYNSPFDFNKKNNDQKPILGTIIGFSTTMNEFFGITESNSKKLDEIVSNLGGGLFNYGSNRNISEKAQKELEQMNITPNNNIENKVGILLDNSLINKETFNLQELVPKVFNQCKVMPILISINFDKFEIKPETIDYYVDFLEQNMNAIEESNDKNKNNNNIINLCTNIIRFLFNFFEYYSKNSKEGKNINITPKLISFISKNASIPIYHGNHFMNLEFNEEKLYRIANYCNENKESLEDIPQVSIKFISNTNYILRLYNNSDKNISLSNNIINIENKNLFNSLIDNGYHDFYLYSNKDTLLENIKNHNQKNFILFVQKEQNSENNYLDEIINYIRNCKKNYKISNFVVISDQVNKSLKKEDNICYVQIFEDELNEIIDIMKELENKSQKEYNNEILKMLYKNDKYKNEKEKLLDELIKDFGFEKENIEKIMKDSPDMDLNELINNLLEVSKPDESKQKQEMELLQQEINIQPTPRRDAVGDYLTRRFNLMDNNNMWSPVEPDDQYISPEIQMLLNTIEMPNIGMGMNMDERMNMVMNMNMNNMGDNHSIQNINRERREEMFAPSRQSNKKAKKDKKEIDPIQKKIEDEKKRLEGGDKTKTKIKISKKDKQNDDFEEDKKKNENEEDEKDEQNNEEEEEVEKKENEENNVIENNGEQMQSLPESAQNKEEKVEEEDKKDIMEKETKNDCFGFDNEKNIVSQDEFENELFINKITDESNLFLIYKNLNKKINILYSRRLVLSLLKLCLRKNNSENLKIFLETISKEDLYNIIKLLVHEGLFINLMELGAELLLSIKKMLLNLIKSKNKNSKEIIEYFIKKCLEEIKSVNDSPSFEYKNNNFSNEIEIIDKPFIFFDVWIIMIFSDPEDNNIENINNDFYTVFNSLSGLIIKIKENKEIRWFIMDTLINYCHNILSLLNSDKNNSILEELKKQNIIKFEFIPNILKLELYLKQSIYNEGKKNLSKRTQMITEILILISFIDKKIKILRKENDDKRKDEDIYGKDLKEKFILKPMDENDLKYKEIYGENKQGELQYFIYELLSTSKIMKNFFKMNYIKYLAWNEMNPERLSDNEVTFESSHLYSKAPLTYLLEYPDVNNFEIKLDNMSYFDEGDCILFSSDKNCKNIIKCVLNDNQNKFALTSPFVYVTFPGSYISKLYAFGINNFGKLGISSNSKEISTPKLISQCANMKIQDIKIGDTSCFILTNDGEILSAGYGATSGIDSASEIFKVPEKFRNEKFISNEKVNFIGMYNQNIIINTQDGALWSIGNNIQGALGHDYSANINELKCMTYKLKSPLTSLSLGTNHTVFTTADGKLFFLGSNDKLQMGENTGGARSNTPKEISYKPTDFYIMASAGDCFTALIIKDKKTGKKKLYTAGWGKDGRAGIDEKSDTHLVHMFEDAKHKDREFRFVSTSETTGAAISEDGKLYTWGSNYKGECGHGSYTIINVPTLVKYFDKDYFVLDACAISQATIVIAKHIKTNKVSLFCMGDNANSRLGMSIPSNYEIKDTYPIPVKNPFFDGKNPEKIFGGSKGVIVKCKVEKIEELRDNFDCLCSDCNKNIYHKMGCNINDKKLLCEECSEKDEYQSKDIIIFKAKLPEKNNFILEKVEDIFGDQKIEKEKNENKLVCEGCLQKIVINQKNKFYYTYHIIDNNSEQSKNKKIIRKYLCSFCLDHFPPCLNNIKIFYRSNNTQEVIALNSLEKLLNEEKYYEISNAYGYKYSVSLTFNDEGCEKIISKHQKEFDSFTRDLKEVNKFEVYEQFVDYLNEMSQKAEKSLFSYNTKDLTFKKENLSVRNELVNCSNEVLKKMFVLLKILNVRVKELLPYIDFSRSLSDSERLSDLFTSISPLIFWDTKNEMIQYYLEKTCFNCTARDLKINRFKAKKFIEKGKPDLLGEHTVFGQVFQFLRTYPFKIFRKKKIDTKNIAAERNNKLFSASFQGEASIDAGGPYRECLSTIYTELQSSALTLFIPTPNQKNDSGSFREKWTVNPGAISNTELEMFKIFGGLMGYAIRTGEFFNMDLCSIFWKSILEIEKDRKDLEKFDKYCVQFLDNIEHTNDKDSFVLFTDYKFATSLSNGTEVELCENGNNKFLSLENKKLFIDLVEKTRLNEGKLQIQAIRNGLEQVIPSGLLRLLSWNELEMLVCGKPILDVELLKENTLYSGCSENDELIKNFWKCLEEFNAEERASYLRFVWGRSRLPLTSKDFPMQHRISILSHGNPDVALPTSHTCFFSIDIPRYSSYEHLKNKLKYAITHCQAIDTDGAPREIWDDEE